MSARANFAFPVQGFVSVFIRSKSFQRFLSVFIRSKKFFLNIGSRSQFQEMESLDSFAINFEERHFVDLNASNLNRDYVPEKLLRTCDYVPLEATTQTELECK